MKALILAAGYATRLYPLTKDYPKPLLKVWNRPIIDYIIEKINRIREIDAVCVITNSKFIAHFRKWKLKAESKKCICIIDDQTKDNATRLGAIGDMEFAISKKNINDDLLVIGGDNLFSENLDAFVEFSRRKKHSPVMGVFNLGNKLEATKYGVIKLDKQNKIIDFSEKPKRPKSSLVAMCLYYFPKTKLKLIEKFWRASGKKADATGVYIDWLRKKVAVYGFTFSGNWYDIGDFKFYNKAKKTFFG